MLAWWFSIAWYLLLCSDRVRCDRNKTSFVWNDGFQLFFVHFFTLTLINSHFPGPLSIDVVSPPASKLFPHRTICTKSVRARAATQWRAMVHKFQAPLLCIDVDDWRRQMLYHSHTFIYMHTHKTHKHQPRPGPFWRIKWCHLCKCVKYLSPSPQSLGLNGN